jgi:hypothetical protein
MWSDAGRGHDEDGVALIAALLAVVILMGLSVVFVAVATFETRSTAGARDAETAIHVAEGAVDDLIPRVNLAPDEYVTQQADGTPHVVPADATAEEERDLILEYAAEADPGETGDGPRLVRFGTGEGLAIRPVDDDDDPRDVMYAVGWVPSRDAAVRTRVVKVRFDTLRFNPNVGLLTGGDLTFGGSAKVTGSGGTVHANGDASSQPGNFSVSGDLMETGSLEEALCDEKKVAGDCYGGAARRPVPEIDAREMYLLHGQNSAPWFDLCPPGPDTVPTVREHSPVGPCEGDLVEWDAGSESFRGWRYQDGEWRATHAHPGVYYAHRSNARITGTTGSEQQPLTVIASAASGDAGGDAGNIVTSGNPQLVSALSGMTLVADRDIVLGGTVTLEGLVAAHEQVDIPGNVHITGAVIAEDAPHTTGSPGSKSPVAGNMTIDYDGTLEVPLAGVIRITAWNEL